MTIEILIMLIAFQFKHLIADYYLQFPFMYENKGKEHGWFIPLMSHSLIHGIGTTWIIIGWILYTPSTSLFVGLLPFFDLMTHFLTDRWKATRKTNPSQSWFWKSLGIDQMIHHIVGIIIIWSIV